METFINLIGTPLGYIMYWCFELLQNYGAAILLFTLLTKIILFPLSVVAQKNSIVMVKMQPQLADIRMRNSGNGELIMQETRALYKKERYSTLKGLLPLLIQIPLILGLIDVVYNPLLHLLHFDNQTITVLISHTAEILGFSTNELGFGAQVLVLETVQNNPGAFSQLLLPGGDSIASAVSQINAMNLSFLGIDLAATPKLTEITILAPIFSALSALGLCLVQNRYNVLQANSGFVGRWGMAIFLVAFSGYFAFVLPCGFGLYWTAGNLLSIPVLALCNLIYSPKEYLDRARRAMPARPSHAERTAAHNRARELAKREKADSKRFFAPGLKKNLVIYSEGSGYWKYFFAIVDYISKHSDIVIHYVTNDPNDRVFDGGAQSGAAASPSQLIPYYIGPKALIAFMMKMDADIVLMTTPDLETFHVKRSLVRKDVEYIYLDHGMGSLQLMLRKGALDHFDTVFAYGPNHIEEVRETEKLYNLPPKTIVKTGYGLLDELLERVAAMDINRASDCGENKQILIGPSWQPDNLLDLCIDDILDELLGHGYRIIVRPHPEYVKRFPDRVKAFRQRYAKQMEHPDEKGGTLAFETDFSSNETVYRSDLVITDWSSIAQEFSYATKKPSLFINTPMKVMNPEWNQLPLTPLDISLRDELGVSVDTDKLEGLANTIDDILARSDEYRAHITHVVESNIYDIGNAARGGGNYLIARIKEIEYLRAVGKDPAIYAKPGAAKQFGDAEQGVRRAQTGPLRMNRQRN